MQEEERKRQECCNGSTLGSEDEHIEIISRRMSHFSAEGAVIQSYEDLVVYKESYLLSLKIFDFVKRAGRADAQAQRRFFREMWASGTYAPKLAIERGRWKIVRDAVLGDDVLYDLERDTRETKNLAAERPAELGAMRKALDDWTRDQVSVLKRLDRLQ